MKRGGLRWPWPPQAAPHLLVLCCCLVMLLAAVVLAHFDQRRAHLTIGSQRLPSTCMLRNTTGIPCPGCGLTRSWVALVAGDVARSVRQHRLGWLIMIYALLQAARHAAWLLLAAARDGIERLGSRLDRGLIVIAVLLLLNWVVTLADHFELLVPS